MAKDYSRAVRVIMAYYEMNQKEIAAPAGISSATISDIVLGKTKKMNKKIVVNIEKSLRLPIGFINDFASIISVDDPDREKLCDLYEQLRMSSHVVLNPICEYEEDIVNSRIDYDKIADIILEKISGKNLVQRV